MIQHYLKQPLFLLVALELACGFTAAPFGHAADVERVAVLRDGTLIKVSLPDEPLPWRRIGEDGRVLEEPVKLSEVHRLRLVKTPATDQIALVRKLAGQLGDVDFQRREAAQAELLKLGAKFRDIMADYLAKTGDMEVKWRLGVLLRSLPAGQGLIDVDYDLLTAADPEKQIAGDVGSWSPAVKYGGAPLKFDRNTVAALGEIPLLPKPEPGPPAARVRRIEANEDRFFPMNVTRLDFDRGPHGENLADDRDIATIFAPLGCTFAVEMPDVTPAPFMSVQSYNVGGRSGGKCAATYSPRYQGTLVIRFCVPEFDRIPAGVRYVGMSVSHVAPKGTVLSAFDALGRKLGEVATTRTGTDFLAISSNTPIAYVKAAPNLEIDKDFAIDDLTFDPPKALAESADGQRCSVLFTSGERLYCGAVDQVDRRVVLKQLSFGAEELKLAAAEVSAIAWPQRKGDAAEPEKSCFVRLSEGSLIRTTTNGAFKPLRFPKFEVRPEHVTALWGGRVTADMPDEDAPLEPAALLVQRDQAAKPLTKWKLGAKWIESPDLTDLFDFSYADSPPVWLRKSTPRPADSGLIRLSSGEELVLSPEAFTLARWSSAGFSISRGGEETAIPAGEISSVVFPKNAK